MLFQGYLNMFWHHESCFWSNTWQKATFLLLSNLKSTFFFKKWLLKQNKLKSLKVAKWKIKEDGHFADRQMDIGDYYLVFYSTSTNNHICPKIREPFQKRSILRGNVPTVNECSSMWNSFVFEKSRNNFLFFLKIFFPP